MSKNFQHMSTEELKLYLKTNREDELAFLEYSSRFDWSKAPQFNSQQEEEQFIDNLIKNKIRH